MDALGFFIAICAVVAVVALVALTIAGRRPSPRNQSGLDPQADADGTGERPVHRDPDPEGQAGGRARMTPPGHESGR
jgi:hypothetical protein